MKIDYLKCTIDGKPMESYFSGIPTIQNTDGWIFEEKRRIEYVKELRSLIEESKQQKINEVKT